MATVAEAYRAAMKAAGGACPIEAGLLGNLADNECEHGRLPSDRKTIACGCWPGIDKGLVILEPEIVEPVLEPHVEPYLLPILEVLAA